MKFINFDNYIKKMIMNNIIYKNCFVPQHPSNTVIVGATGCSKTNLLFNILTLNPVYEKYILLQNNQKINIIFHYKNFPMMLKYFTIMMDMI